MQLSHTTTRSAAASSLLHLQGRRRLQPRHRSVNGSSSADRPMPGSFPCILVIGGTGCEFRTRPTTLHGSRVVGLTVGYGVSDVIGKIFKARQVRKERQLDG